MENDEDVNVRVFSCVASGIGTEENQVGESIGRADWGWYELFVRQWSEAGRGSAVLVTSHRSVVAVEPIALTGLSEAEGIAFFEREGITGEGRSVLINLASGHPLLLKLVAAWTRETYGARVDGRAIDFFEKLFKNYVGDPTAGVGVIFDVLFNELPIALQGLLVKLSVYRLPIGLEMARAMDETVTVEDLVLAGRGLLLGQEDCFVLHPLVESFVRSKLTEDDFLREASQRVVAHEGAIGYFDANIKPASAEMVLEDCRSELEIFYHACEIGNYQKAYSIYRTIDDFLDKRGFWRDQVRLLETLIEHWGQREDNREEIGACYCYLGNAYQSLGQYQRAIDFHQQCLEIEREIGDSPEERLRQRNGIAGSLGNLGLAYDSLGQCQRAIDFLQQCLEIAREIGDRQGIANSLGSLGNAYQSLGQYQRAIEFQQQHNEITREIGDRNGEATSLGNLGNAYYFLGEYQRAIEFQQQHNEIIREIGDRNGEANSLGNLGNSYRSLGQYQRAIGFLQQGLEIMREIGDRNGEATSLGGLGDAYYCLGQYQRTIDFHQQSIEIVCEIGDRNGEATSLGNLGLAYYSLGQYQRAIEFHQQSIEISCEIGDRDGEANSLNSLAATLVKIDEHFNAMQYLKKAKAIYEELNLSHRIEMCQNNIEVCNRAVAIERRSPPAIDQTPKESMIEWYEREKQANRPVPRNAENDRRMNQIFYFCIGLVICFVVWKIKN